MFSLDWQGLVHGPCIQKACIVVNVSISALWLHWYAVQLSGDSEGAAMCLTSFFHDQCQQHLVMTKMQVQILKR